MDDTARTRIEDPSRSPGLALPVELLLIEVHPKLVLSSCEERQCGGISAAVKTMITAGGTK